jgi:hypothetical protein
MTNGLGDGIELEFNGSTADIGRWGMLTHSSGSSLAIKNRSGGIRDLDFLPAEFFRLKCWLYEEGGLLVVGASRENRIFVFDLNYDEVIEEIDLERNIDEAFQHFEYFRAGNGTLGVLCESAILVLGRDGHLLWNRSHADFTARFVGIQDGLIEIRRYSNPSYPQGEALYYSASTGATESHNS